VFFKNAWHFEMYAAGLLVFSSSLVKLAAFSVLLDLFYTYGGRFDQ
jgi:hypothetical protein